MSNALVGLIVISPMLAGFLLILIGFLLKPNSVENDDVHAALRTFLWLLGIFSFIVSIQWATQALIQFHPTATALINTMADTVEWFTWVWYALITYWIINIIIYSLNLAAQKKQEREDY